MIFQIGDKVIHMTHGLGEIERIEDKIIDGRSTSCYVVHTLDLLIWIPIDDLPQSSLRMPTPPEECERLVAILHSPSEALLGDRLLRKDQLMLQMKSGQLASICRVVRDLTHYKRSARLTDQEASILKRAIASLLTEWTYSLKIPLSQAQQSMTNLLAE
jgi:RNA polymerase-interacting CarD/CdnL/TRCF family regulator